MECGAGRISADFIVDVCLCPSAWYARPPCTEVKRMFVELDCDGSGAIDAGEMRVLLQKMGVYLTARELDLAVQSIDKDGSVSADSQMIPKLRLRLGGDMLARTVQASRVANFRVQSAYPHGLMRREK
eukprot:COSAG03_NODE_48_length_16512_cov_10.183818_10_plen_128_part_00